MKAFDDDPEEELLMKVSLRYRKLRSELLELTPRELAWHIAAVKYEMDKTQETINNG